MANNNYTIPQGSLIGFMSNKVKTSGGINLAQVIPGFEPPVALTKILSEIAAEPFHQYAAGIGNVQLRAQILERYRKNIAVDDNNLLITNGATEALSLIFHYINTITPEPFSAMAMSPVYESYRHLPSFYNRLFIEYSFDQNNPINFGNLEQTIQENNTKVLFVGSPGNPFGFVFSKRELMHLQTVCERNKCFLILDAVYHELYYEIKPEFPIETITPYLFYVDSFSKLFSITGWRIGYFMTHECHTQAIRNIHDYTGLCASSILQEALTQYIELSDFGQAYVNELRKKLCENYIKISESLKKLDFTVPQARGGYFVWAKLPEKFTDGFKFAIDLYDNTGVAVVPGIHFTKHGTQFIRINIARESDEIELGLKKISEFVLET
jgi:aspartate/methionine/tyrosine aminotransferase